MAKAPDDADEQFRRCAASYGYFADNYLVIDDAQDHGDGSGVMRFRLWEDQFSAAETLSLERLVIFLKARQLGITWLCLGYALWLMLFHPGKTVFLFSQGETEAVEMLRRVQVMYERLPAWMLGRLPARVRSNMTEQGWANGSRCKSMPATERAGRSFTASLAILDEAAHLQYGRKLYAALKPTIDGGGKLFVISSANGSDGFFDKLWHKAIEKKNSFRTIFLSWRSRPGRDQEWYDRQVAEATDLDLVRQEYPSNPTEAFIASGRVRFAWQWINAQAANIEEPIPRDALPAELAALDGLSVFRLPRDDGRQRVGIGCDVAEGLEGGDFDHAVVVDMDTREELACLHGTWEPDEFATLVYALAKFYRAWVVPERNNHGGTMILKLRDLECKGIADGPDGRMGWITTVKSKPMMIDDIAVHLRDESMVVHDAATLRELQGFRKLGNGRTGAPEGEHDDRVMAWAVLFGWILFREEAPIATAVENPTLDRRWGT